MFEHTKAFSGFSADDIPAASKFYGETLGIPVSEENGILTLHIAGGRDTIVYPKPDHTPATFTILNFPVDDIEAAVDALTARGGRVRTLRFRRFQGDQPPRRPAHRLVQGPGSTTSCRSSRRLTTPGQPAASRLGQPAGLTAGQPGGADGRAAGLDGRANRGWTVGRPRG